jgi:hypothetical protein
VDPTDKSGVPSDKIIGDQRGSAIIERYIDASNDKIPDLAANIASGGTNASTASIVSFNNITGFAATGATGTTSTNLVFSASPVFSGSVGIGATPAASAVLDAQSTTQGVRFPNMTTTQKNAIGTPVAGLVIFDITLAKLCVYSGTAWQTITSV